MHVASLLFDQQRALERAAMALEGGARDAVPILLRFLRDALTHLRLEEALSRVVASRTTELWTSRNDDAGEHLRLAMCGLAHTPSEAPDYVLIARELRGALRDQIAYENEELVPAMLRWCTDAELAQIRAKYGPPTGTGSTDDVTAA